MKKEIYFSSKELLALEDTDFLLTKKKVVNKIFKLMEITREGLINYSRNSEFSFPAACTTITGKISRGENYLGLPYMVLDYPSLFSKEDVFSYRTMFWWGNFFSATLHLEGSSLNYYRNTLLNNIDKLLKQSIYISVGNSPWQYHYGKENYALLVENHIDHITNCKFLKLSRKIDIMEWDIVPEFSLKFLKLVLTALKEKYASGA